MPATAVLTEDATVISEDDAGERRFSWAAAFAGAICAMAVHVFLLFLGSGVGLSLYTAPELLRGSGPTFLTLGAVYFFASAAFAFAVGGYMAGRLMNPAIETNREEEFRSAAHGMVVWGLCVGASISALILFGTIASGAATGAMAAATQNTGSGALTPAATAYWVDDLFRGSHASATGTAADKAEAGRILTTGLAKAGALDPDDSGRVTTLVSRNTGVSEDEARRRLGDVQARIEQATDNARKIARDASLWMAFALLFGLIVAIFSAIAARHMDDRVTFGVR